VFYYDSRLVAVRQGPYKLFLPGRQRPAPVAGSAELYNLDEDPSEKFDLATKLPDVVARLQKLAAAHEASFVPAPTQLGRGPS
jgi:arylsulfatase A